MELQNDFDTFLQNIRPTESQRQDMRSGHTTLRKRLHEDEFCATITISSFLQGSYRRATAVRPKAGKRSDVDIIVVTNLHESDHTPSKAIGLFVPFVEKHYKGKYCIQGRSIGIELSYVDLDLVITSAPSESELGILQSDAVTTDEDISEARDWKLNQYWVEPNTRFKENNIAAKMARSRQEPEWKAEPLRIPDRDASRWKDTHPLAQIQWTRDKNAQSNGHFVNVVKALKWWRLQNYEEPTRPKGFPLERLIGECCPGDINSVAMGIALTLENIVSTFRGVVEAGGKPVLPDYGVPLHDVFDRIPDNDFKAFFKQTEEAARLARSAIDSTDRSESVRLWHDLLGNPFPKPSGGSEVKAAFVRPQEPAIPGSGRFA